MQEIKNKILEELKTIPDTKMDITAAKISIGMVEVITVLVICDTLHIDTKRDGKYNIDHLTEEQLLQVFDIVVPDLFNL